MDSPWSLRKTKKFIKRLLVLVFMSKNYVVAISEEVRQIALVKAAEAQKRLGRRVTIQETVEAGVKLLDVEALVKYLEVKNK